MLLKAIQDKWHIWVVWGTFQMCKVLREFSKSALPSFSRPVIGGRQSTIVQDT